ncbi:MAG: PEP-CTERM sorting domain-containing protein [Phycisphaeraceae bacterium]
MRRRSKPVFGVACHWGVRLWAVTASTLFFAVTAAQAAPQTEMAYFIGNSVTDTIGYTALEQMIEARGHQHIWGRHTIPGAPLEYTWNNPFVGNAENQQAGSGGQPGYTDALPNYTWNAIVLQPYDHRASTDYTYTSAFINLATQNPANADAQVYLMSRWPRRTSDGAGDFLPFDFRTLWDAQYAGIDNSPNDTENRDYFQELVGILTDPLATTDPGTIDDTPLELLPGDDHPSALLNKPILLIPVGDVMYELENRLRSDPGSSLSLYGIDAVEDLYADGVHLNDMGRFVVGTVVAATLYKESPVGLPSSPYANGSPFNPDFVTLVQTTTWDVVKGHPYSGVPLPEPGTLALLSLGGLAILRRRGSLG